MEKGGRVLNKLMPSRCNVSNKLWETGNELSKWVPNIDDISKDFEKITYVLNKSLPDGGNKNIY